MLTLSTMVLYDPTHTERLYDQQLAMVVTQLEQEKGDLSRRLQRLQGDLKEKDCKCPTILNVLLFIVFRRVTMQVVKY